ncbi:MAG TPA: hypothetical protein VEA69_17780 [Tepidisphaeraceae bacterium]|nr:hypothetical protein [Tepidisphaeraceae bacterium]
MSATLTDRPAIESAVTRALWEQPVVDMHTHLYPPSFGTPVVNATGKTDHAGMMLYGVDELITYHYLIAEVFRVVPATKLPYEQFWRMSKREQADHIWKHLFVERTPISEACRGVLTTLHLLGLDVDSDKTLEPARKWFAQQDPSKYVDRVMELANVESITMTNAVFDDVERNKWLADPKVGFDPRFTAVLRIDPVLIDWPAASKKLTEWGFACSTTVDEKTVENGRKFLRHWIDLQKAIYVAVSLPPDFTYGSGAVSDQVFEKILLPVLAERGLPFAMMIGARRGANPALRDAADMGGVSDVQSVAKLCRDFPQNKFFCTMLARENQHELAVAARKFGNLMVFGCWWFLNNPSLIDEITRMRLELLGTSMIPQHSDARVLDQLLYKWEHSRELIARALTDKYHDTARTGWPLTDADIRGDVKRLVKDNFLEFLAR